jgi:hypothetical protein
MKKLLAVFLLLSSFVLSPAADAPAKAADLTGTWDLTIETSQGTGHPVFTLKQEGDKLTGKYTGLFGEADLTGTITADHFTFSFTANIQGNDVKLTYTGTTEGDTMKGTADFGGAASGSFTGKRRT